jgi:hypothetical protein
MEREEGAGMNWQGWVFMLSAWGLIGVLFFYSFYRVLFDKQMQKKRENNNQKNK